MRGQHATIGLTVSLWGFKDGAIYKAVCPELSLLVRRDNLDEAMRELVTLVEDYVASREADAASILRPVPRSERVRLYLVKLLRLILRRLASELLRREPEAPRMEIRALGI